MSTSNLLRDDVAIVTGAGRGIGRAAALALAQAGAAVVLAARSESEIQGVADEIKTNGGRAIAIPTDVSDPAQVDHLLVLTLRAFRQVTILLNNAALVQPIGKVWETSPRAWQKLIAVNVMGPYLCSRVMLPHMLERGSGRIINISSGAADSNIAGVSAYTTSKAALERFSGTLAAEISGSGVQTALLRPGIVDTPMQQQMRESSQERFPLVGMWQKWHQEQQLRPPQEPAQAIVWLASHLSGDINGQTFSIDDKQFRERLAADLEQEKLKPRKR